jgi:hypothetical protein
MAGGRPAGRGEVYGACVDFPGICVEVYGVSVEVYGICVEVYGTPVDVYGTFVDVYGAGVEVYGNFVDLHGTSAERRARRPVAAKAAPSCHCGGRGPRGGGLPLAVMGGAL